MRSGYVTDGLAIDSRKLKPGDLFLAYPGERADGRAHSFAQAIAAGAAAVLWESRNFEWNRGLAACRICGVPDLRSQLG